MARPRVAPHAGAWIEINPPILRVIVQQSLPTRERGLKSDNFAQKKPPERRSPRGSVD